MNSFSKIVVVAGVLSIALLAQSADRVRAGQWVGTTITGGKTYPTSSCITKADAEALNSGPKAVEAYLQKLIPPEICKITNVKVDGKQVVYTATCSGAPPKVVTTAYHGDSSEGTDSGGGKTTGKLVGACK